LSKIDQPVGDNQDLLPNEDHNEVRKAAEKWPEYDPVVENEGIESEV
jgi:hypothetical protein